MKSNACLIRLLIFQKVRFLLNITVLSTMKKKKSPRQCTCIDILNLVAIFFENLFSKAICYSNNVVPRSTKIIWQPSYESSLQNTPSKWNIHINFLAHSKLFTAICIFNVIEYF